MIKECVKDKKRKLWRIFTRSLTLLSIVLIITLLSACHKNMSNEKEEVLETIKTEIITEKEEDVGNDDIKLDDITELRLEYPYEKELNIMDDKYRTYYEVFLYSFYDSDGDGIGDLNGLSSKLDYISELGFNGIWLMPIMPSSTYHKYDVENYYEVDKEYGNLEDFKKLIEECDKRGIKIIIDFVVNHSSNLHPWFLSALNGLSTSACGQELCIHQEGCITHNPYIDYYNFSKGKPNHGSYYPTHVDDWYYEGAFTSNMPDLNLDNLALREELKSIMKFWIDMGVDGFRLDAAMHFFNGESKRNIGALAFINDYSKSLNPDIYIVAEIWTNFSKYVTYYESGIDSVFNFAFATESGIIAKTLNSVNNKSVGKAFSEAMMQVESGIKKNNESGIDASFFTNHDTARAAGYFNNNLDKIKMAQGMNLMMSGSTFVYYGEELGMSGSGRDENKRAPMYWSDGEDKIGNSASGMTIGPKEMEEVIHKYGSLNEQVDDPLSIYHYVKRAVRIRNENPEIARGNITSIIGFEDNRITMIKKEYEGDPIYILYNFTDQVIHINLKEKGLEEAKIQGYLSVNGATIYELESSITVSPYGIVILK